MTRDRSALPRRSETERFMFGDPELGDDQFVRAMVPAFHSVELEVGAFTGLYPLYRCTADCDKNPIIVPHTVEDASLQVTLFYAGIRYVYYRSASSEQVPFRSHAGFEAAIDAIHNPFTVRDAGLFNIYDGHPTHEPVGFRVKLSLPSLKCIANGPCLGVDLMGGYLPTPSDGMFSVNAVVQ